MNLLHETVNSGCGCCGLSRRQFLAGCAACAAGVSSLPAAEATAEAGRPKVRLVFSYTSSAGPIWPNIGFDFEPRKREVLAALSKGCPGVEWLPATVMNAAEAKKLLEEDKAKGVDGYLVYIMALWNNVPMTIAGSGKPTVFADFLYGGSGEFLIANAGARRRKLDVSCVSSSRLEDLVAAGNCFAVLKQPGGTAAKFVAACDAVRKQNTVRSADRSCPADPLMNAIDAGECLKRLKDSTVLVVGGGWMPGEVVQKVFGTKVVAMDFKELGTFYLKADRDEAQQVADRWMGQAEKVIEPTAETIRQSGAMYLAMKRLMKKYDARAITINCLGGFYGGHIKAYPCLGFAQLNDDGFVGACEGDVVSMMTMLTMSHLVGRPGFISDPVLDTSKNRIIYAHCVAPTKVFGPQGLTNPFHIRSHSEDRKGAATRSLLPLGRITTTLEFHAARKEVILHQAKTVENVDDDKACRTKLAAEVLGDIEKLMNTWDQWGWHRVTFYGDLKEPVREMAKALGMQVVEEA